MSFTDTLPKVQELVNNLLIVLSEKEKFIIENRFSLNDNPRLTLESIGQKYEVTRERIRQIEKNALKKLARNVNNTLLFEITTLAKEVLEEYGGIIEEDRIVTEILARIEDPEKIDVSSLKLTVNLELEINHMHNTIQFKPYWKFSHVDSSNVKAICNAAYKKLKASKTEEVLDCDTLAASVLKDLKLNETSRFASSCFELDRRIYLLEDGNVGLTAWRSINPKTLRDKVFYILKDHEQPLHYVEISNKISALSFDNKTINTQAVHNELIRHEGFVLIGRGIYALKEWGYEEGTVSDVIQKILAASGEPMSREDIIAAVLERRQVKKITIQLNLKNKPEFERVGKNKYQLVKK